MNLRELFEQKTSASALILARDARRAYDSAISSVQMQVCGSTTSEMAETISAGVHPDVRILTELGIDEIRGIISWSSISTTGKKVCLIPEANRLTISAANAILKTLEEPPKNVYFILMSSNRYLLLSTILSRCQIITYTDADDGKFYGYDYEYVRELFDWFGKAVIGSASAVIEKEKFSDLEGNLIILSIILMLMMKRKYGFSTENAELDRKIDFFLKNYSMQFIVENYDNIQEQLRIAKMGYNPDLKFYIEIVALQFMKRYRR